MKRQILIVDDELCILKLLNFILSNDYNLVIKQNGLDALRWLEEGNVPALIISDMEMPYIDGNTFIRNLRISGLYRHIPVILLSGADDLDGIVKSMQFQADMVLKKPFDPAQLKTFIKTALTESDVTHS